jgi:WD40 repeat protein
VGAIAVAPDGRVAVARGTSIEVRSDDLGTSLVTLQGHQASVDSLAFARDGELLASGSDDRTISLWDTGSWTQLRTLFGHNDKVTGLSFAAEDRLLASVSQDGTLRLWDPPTGQPIGGPMRTDTRAIDNIVTVGPSATVALTLAGDDVTTWDLDVDGWAGRACALAGRALSEEEWAVYSDGRPYEPSCER